MNHRYPVQLTTLEEDFRKIGLLPEEQLTESHGPEGQELTELDDPRRPRDIPSPDPSSLGGGVDDSEGSINKNARHRYANQPRPRIAPDDKDDHQDPMDAGGKMSSKGGSYSKKPNYREAHDGNPKAEYPDGYKTLRKRLVDKSKGAHYDGGEDPQVAHGLSPVNKHAGMYRNTGKGKMESGYVNRATELIGELDALVRGSQVSEDFDSLDRGFSLLGENAALLAERLVEISDVFDVEDAFEAMEDLHGEATEAIDILEMKVSFDADKKAAIANGRKVKEEEVDEDDLSMEDIKDAFRLMTLKLMDAVEAYDYAIAEMSEKKHSKHDDDDDDDDDDDKCESVSDRLEALRQARGAGPLGR